MARRRGKSSSKQDDNWLPLEPPAGHSSRGVSEYVIPGVLLLIIAVGGSGLGWVCSDHQQTIDSLSETLASMQARIIKLQQQLEPDNAAQLASEGGFEERLVALEDAYAKAQRQVELALATSEQIKSKDLQNKVWSLQTEMNDKLAELQQNTISIAALSAIIKNKSIEFEVVKQSVSTMLSTNTELSLQMSGFSSQLSFTNLRLDEQISVVDGLMSRLEGQKREINEIKDLFATNRELLATNTQEVIDIKELLESEQIKRTHKLERQLRSLYHRLEDLQTNTDKIYVHLTAQMEALQIQRLSENQQSSRPEEEVHIEEQVTTSDNKERKKLENTKEKDKFREDKEVKVEDGEKEEDSVNGKQPVAEEFEPQEWPVDKPTKESQSPSAEVGTETEVGATEEQKELHISGEKETLQEAHTVTNEMKETVDDKLQTTLEDLDQVTLKTGEFVDKKVEVNEEDIRIHSEKANIVTSEPEKPIEVPDANQINLNDSSTTPTETEETSAVKQEELNSAQEMQMGSEETDMPTHIIDEENTDHTVEEIQKILNKILTTEIKSQEDGDTEQESGTAVEEIPILSDETDTATNGNVDDQMRDIIPAEPEQEEVEEPLAKSAKETLKAE